MPDLKNLKKVYACLNKQVQIQQETAFSLISPSPFLTCTRGKHHNLPLQVLNKWQLLQSHIWESLRKEIKSVRFQFPLQNISLQCSALKYRTWWGTSGTSFSWCRVWGLSILSASSSAEQCKLCQGPSSHCYTDSELSFLAPVPGSNNQTTRSLKMQ